MNIAQAKQIPIRDLVEYLGGRFSHSPRPGELWYYSPFRPEEKTASFKIDEVNKTWHDFGHFAASSPSQGSGGDILNLWCDYYGQDRKAVKDALSGLERFSGGRVAATPQQRTQRRKIGQRSASESQGKGDRFKLAKQPARIFFESLKQELDRRGISQAAALPFLKQAYIQDTKTGKHYNGFAFANSKGGFEISIPNPAKQTNFKTCIGQKAPTYIMAHSATTYLIFEGFFDFLTWQEMNRFRQLDQHAIILNSLSFLGQALQTIRNRKEFTLNVIEFLDNDNAGEMARTQFFDFMDEARIEAASAAHIYKGYDDLNAWWCQAPGVRTQWHQPAQPEQKTYYDTAWNMVMNKPKP